MVTVVGEATLQEREARTAEEAEEAEEADKAEEAENKVAGVDDTTLQEPPGSQL